MCIYVYIYINRIPTECQHSTDRVPATAGPGTLASPASDALAGLARRAAGQASCSAAAAWLVFCWYLCRAFGASAPKARRSALVYQQKLIKTKIIENESKIDEIMNI